MPVPVSYTPPNLRCKHHSHDYRDNRKTGPADSVQRPKEGARSRIAEVFLAEDKQEKKDGDDADPVD